MKEDNMEEMGLAGASAMQGQQEGQEEIVEQVIQALMQGMSPEELLQQGVPAEIIQMAIQMIKQQMQASQSPTPAAEQGGLAAASMPMM